MQNKYGYSERIFSKLAEEYSIPKNNKLIAINKNKYHAVNLNLKEILELYNKNISIREIAEKYKTTHSTISKFLKNNGVSIKSGHSKIYYEKRKVEFSKSDKIDSGGYIRVHYNGKETREHIYVMEQHLGRKLDPQEYVYHIDGDETNNNIDNLFVFESNSIHGLYHGYIMWHNYMSPNEYMEYYNLNLRGKIDDYNWLYDQYIKQFKSCNSIAKELQLSRTAVTNYLKNTGIYYLRKPSIN